MVERTRGYAHRVDIQAPCEYVWRALIDPALLARWCGSEAHVDARPGGSHTVRLDRTTERVAHIDVFDPPRRLRLIYMPQPYWPSAECVIVDDFIVVGDGNGSLVRLLGSGVPEQRSWDPLATQLRDGWGRALLRLKVAVEKARMAESPRARSAR
jgi:uncharacterized protein YndB with AHSA1/START domain